MQIRTALAFMTALALAACGGGSGTSVSPSSPGGGGNWSPSGGSPSTSGETPAQVAVQITNIFGNPLKGMSSFEMDMGGAASAALRRGMTSGSCANGVEVFSPDQHGDANSTEHQYFYDAACTQMARDVVRIWSPGAAPNTENVTVTMKLYSQSGALTAERNDAITLASPKFTSGGFPSLVQGYTRVSTSALGVEASNGVLNQTFLQNDELVMQAASGGVNAYCSDSAGYNTVGFGGPNTSGWAGIMANGSRTANNDGSVTYTGEHVGKGYVGPIGDFGISTGTANTACPISSPLYSISQASLTASQTHDIPYSVTFNNGVLTSLSVQNATITTTANPPVTYSLNVATKPGSDPLAIVGTISTVSESGTSLLATFYVNAFGDGTLVMDPPGGTQTFIITDWHVHA